MSEQIPWKPIMTEEERKMLLRVASQSDRLHRYFFGDHLPGGVSRAEKIDHALDLYDKLLEKDRKGVTTFQHIQDVLFFARMSKAGSRALLWLLGFIAAVAVGLEAMKNLAKLFWGFIVGNG